MSSITPLLPWLRLPYPGRSLARLLQLQNLHRLRTFLQTLASSSHSLHRACSSSCTASAISANFQKSSLLRSSICIAILFPSAPHAINSGFLCQRPGRTRSTAFSS
ncbi:hypothetical protein KSP39_PZI005241 [Platanthera zijinensis]|uniref:Uncharacterized protein n=1 Tax=Platanthera zijinensis TaxID=2320716 RepID=A0AAP0BSM3_9ASPA